MRRILSPRRTDASGGVRKGCALPSPIVCNTIKADNRRPIMTSWSIVLTAAALAAAPSDATIQVDAGHVVNRNEHS